MLQVQVTVAHVHIASHRGVYPYVPGARFHVAADGTIDLYIPDGGSHVSFDLALDPHIAPGGGDLVDALALPHNYVPHHLLFRGVGRVRRNEGCQKERAEEQAGWLSHASLARRPRLTETTARAIRTSTKAPRASTRRMVGPAAMSTARATSVEPSTSPQHAPRMLMARNTGCIPLSSREISAAMSRAPASKPQRTRIFAERVGSAIATPWQTDREHILEKSREHKKALRSSSRSYSSWHSGQEARCSRVSRS